MSSELTYEEKFVKNIQDYMDFGENMLKDCYEAKNTTLSPSGISYAIGYANGKIKDKGNVWVVENFINKTHKHWQQIKDRDVNHFMDKMKELVPFIEDEDMKELKRIFTENDPKGKPLIDKDDKDAFWDFIESFCKLSIHYIHTGRKPIVEGEGFKYTKTFFPDVKVKSAAELFEIKLAIPANK
jgi:hypothetical protein